MITPERDGILDAWPTTRSLWTSPASSCRASWDGASPRCSLASRSREFVREQVAARRSELRNLLDEAGSLLASGLANVRVLPEQTAGAELERARAWLSQVFSERPATAAVAAGRSPGRHLVRARPRALVEATQAGRAQAADVVLEQFERERIAFLDRSRDARPSPIPEIGAGL